MKSRSERLKEIYHLEAHPEGGWFAEVYTSSFEKDGRPLAGSIYFLLDAGEISHFHQIDCDEIWYFHEGCGMTITVLTPEGMEKHLLGNDPGKGERAMVIIPSGSIFAAENRRQDGYSFVSCATAPCFTYQGFRLVDHREVQEQYPEIADEMKHLSWK